MFGPTISSDARPRRSEARDAGKRQRVDVSGGGDSVEQQFAMIAGHELRTPLTVLSGVFRLLARKPEFQDGESKRLVAIAVQETRYLQGFVSSLVGVARLRTGAMSLDTHEYDLNEVIAAAVHRGCFVAPGQEIRFVPHGERIPVRVDKMRVEQIVLNLLDNAAIHAPTSSNIDVRITPGRRQASVHVQDYGRGLPEGDLERLFEPFTRRWESSVPSRAGLGVGLYVARELARVQGGDLDAHSELGAGATFELTLPIAA